jgi:hypothetical protein
MNRAETIGLAFLRFLGFKRNKPRTRVGRYVRTSERALIIVCLLYVAVFALLCFPQVLFAYNVSAKGVTIYSRAPLPPETTSRIDEAMKLVSQSELAVPGRTERIFVCNNSWLYRFFSPINGGDSFAKAYPAIDYIFFADADLVHNISRSNAPVHNQRTFSAVAAHEITHGLIRHHLGLIRGLLLPKWVDEGYADYVSRESSFPEEEGFRELREGTYDPSGSFRYFVYRQMVRHLIEDRHFSFDEIVRRASDEAAIKAETIAALKEDRRP